MIEADRVACTGSSTGLMKNKSFRTLKRTDPYAWKFPSRNETIGDHDIGFNKFDIARQSRSLFTKDIVNSKNVILKSESYSLKNDDIDYSCPRRLHQPLNKPYYYLRDDDIAGTKPAIATFKTKREASNPLNPVYRLPSFEPLEPVIPKFIRDSINVDDIVGTKPKSLNKPQVAERLTNNVRDIDGARPKKDYFRKQIMSPLDVKDINEFRMFRTTRVTNPLEPNYVVPAEDQGQQAVIGFINGSKSKVLHPKFPNGVPDNTGCLINKDILGAQTGTAGNKYIKSQTRTQFRHLTETQDIKGAQTSTLRRGIQTKRQTNPLNPNYQFPGHIQDQDQYNLRISKTHTEGFVQGPIQVSEKPKTPAGVIQNEGLEASDRPVEEVKQPPLFESYVPAAEEPAPKSFNQHQPSNSSKKGNTPKSANLPAVGKRSVAQSSTGEDNKPLHKRIDREEYMKDVQKFYGPAATAQEEPSKISKLIEQLDNQRKVMEKLDRKQKDILHNTKVDNRKTAAQMIDKFIQTV